MERFTSANTFYIFFLLPLLADAVPPRFGDNEGDTLVLVQALWRHGDRSPTKTFKTDKYQESDWPQGWGQLTPTGMAQHVELGRRLRERYVDKLKFVGSRYNSHEIYVRSTDWNRTLISAVSNLIGFYGPGGDDSYPKELGAEKWPGWFVPVAVHSLPGNEDFLVSWEAGCPRLDQLKERVRATPEYNATVRRFKSLLEFLCEHTGQQIDPFDVWMLDDAFFIEKLKGKPLVDWAEGNQTLLDAIAELDHIQTRWINGLGLSPIGGIDFLEEFSRIQGGPILWKMITNMQEKLVCQKKMNAVRESDREISERKSPLGAPLCGWMNKLRYFAYSAHDSTIAALFSAFGLPKTNYDEDGYPLYSTCVTVELWKQKKQSDAQLNVKVFLWKPFVNESEPMEITKDIGGCQNECTLEQFVERSKPYRMLPSPQEYCKRPLEIDPLNSTKNSKGHSLKILVLIYLLAFLLTIG